MTVAPAALPDNPADLQEYCRQLLAELNEKQQLIDKLTHQLALFPRYLYGSRSEQLDPAQLLLEFASWMESRNAGPVAAPPTPPAPQGPAHTRPGHGRTPLPALLPRRRVEHPLPEEACTCTTCGARLVKIGEETSEQLDYQPASVFVTEHVRFTYACHACEGTVVTAEGITAPIEKGGPAPGC
jgi:transposase